MRALPIFSACAHKKKLAYNGEESISINSVDKDISLTFLQTVSRLHKTTMIHAYSFYNVFFSE